MSLPALHHDVIDDLPVHWAEIATTFTGTLLFGVGLRDESARTAGLAHLVEHLIMQRVGKVTVTHNATTADEALMFYAKGSRAAVVDFLERVTAAVTSLDEISDDDIVKQQEVIAAELGTDDQAIGRGALIDRFGNQSLGLLQLGAPAHRSLTRADVLDFAATWLHRGNAAVTLTGAPPPDLTVRLPAARPTPARVRPQVLRESQWIANGLDPLTLSLILGPAPRPVLRAAVNVLTDCLLDDLRGARQLVYSVGTGVHPLGADDIFVTFTMDPRPEKAVDAAENALIVLHRLTTAGPTTQELRAVLDARLDAEDEPAYQEAWLDEWVIDDLRGRPVGDSLRENSDVSVEQVREVLAAALASRFITFADDFLEESDELVTDRLRMLQADDPPPFLAGLSKAERSRYAKTSGAETFSAKMFSSVRGSTIIVDAERLTLDCQGDLVEVRFDQVAAGLFSPRHHVWALVTLGGTVVFLDWDDWRGGERLNTLLMNRIPAHLLVPRHEPDDAIG